MVAWVSYIHTYIPLCISRVYTDYAALVCAVSALPQDPYQPDDFTVITATQAAPTRR